MPRAELFPFSLDLSARGKRELSALASTRAPPGKPLLARGDDAGGAYLVLEGALRVYYITKAGREATLYHVEPGHTCVLALGATLRAEPYPAWVESTSKGVVFVRVPTAMFHHLLEREPAFRSFVLGAMAGRIFELMGSLERVATSTVAQRVATYLAEHADGRGEVTTTQTQLGRELGTAREVVFRALRGLAARGIIALSRGRVKILDAAALSEAARG